MVLPRFRRGGQSIGFAHGVLNVAREPIEIHVVLSHDVSR